MIRPTFVCGLAALAAIVTASGEGLPFNLQDDPG